VSFFGRGCQVLKNKDPFIINPVTVTRYIFDDLRSLHNTHIVIANKVKQSQNIPIMNKIATASEGCLAMTPLPEE